MAHHTKVILTQDLYRKYKKKNIMLFFATQKSSTFLRKDGNKWTKMITFALDFQKHM